MTDHDPTPASPSAQTTPWWESLDEVVADGDDAPDPWGDADLPPAALTDDQADFLAGLVDQPAPARIATPDPFNVRNDD